MLAGRGFEPRDDGDAPRVALINAAAATELFGTDDAVGRRFGFDEEERDEIEVVGVVRDTLYDNLRGAAPPTVFRSAVQSPLLSATFVVRTAGPPNALTPAVRESIPRCGVRQPADSAHAGPAATALSRRTVGATVRARVRDRWDAANPSSRASEHPQAAARTGSPAATWGCCCGR